MNENYEYFIILNPITNEYYEGVGFGINEDKFNKLIKEACPFDTRKDANEYIREWLRIKDLKVKKVKVSYTTSK